MAAAVGYAVTQPWYISISVLEGIGLGWCRTGNRRLGHCTVASAIRTRFCQTSCYIGADYAASSVGRERKTLRGEAARAPFCKTPARRFDDDKMRPNATPLRARARGLADAATSARATDIVTRPHAARRQVRAGLPNATKCNTPRSRENGIASTN